MKLKNIPANKLGLLFVGLIIIIGIGFDKMMDLSGITIYITMGLVGPVSSMLDLFGFFTDTKEKNNLVRLNMADGLLQSYIMPLSSLGLILVFTSSMYIDRNDMQSIEQFSNKEMLAIKIIFALGATLALVAQVGHLLIAITNKFVQYGLKAYLFLFFLAYLSCGLSFAILYSLDKGGLKNMLSGNEIMDCIYFSFVTLATTGYGDIFPVSTLSKVYVILENMIGLFLTCYVIAMIFSAAKKGDSIASKKQ
jgi:hypothetical protein